VLVKHGGNLSEVSGKWQIPVEQIIDFSANLNYFLDKNSVHRLAEKSLEQIFRYPDILYTDLVQAIACYAQVTPQYIVVGNGAIAALYLYFQTIRPAKILIVAPAFMEYAQAAHSVNAAVAYFKIDFENNRLNIDALIAEMHKGYELVVMCNPNNPLSLFTGVAEITELVQAARNAGIRFLLDEAFIDFVAPFHSQSAIDLLADNPNLTILRSLTKCFTIPGLRLGYTLCAASDLNNRMDSVQYPWSINALAASVGCALLSNPEGILPSLKQLDDERSSFYQALTQIPGLAPLYPYANFILVKILSALTAPQLQEKLLAKKILIRDASDFTFLNNAYFRVAIRQKEENALLIQELSRILMNTA